MNTLTRRQFTAGIGLSSAGMFLGVSSTKKADDVTALEDLMREHGVLRRILFVFSEAAARLRSTPLTVAPDALNKAVTLFHAFGEDYHEKKLEEAYIFPALLKARPDTAADIGTLIVQHQRGREINDYILAATRGAAIKTLDAAGLAQAMESLVRMYRPHAAREDTVIFPAWKQTLTAGQLDEIGDRFEEIEHELLGKDGFESAVKQISAIEARLGLTDLSQFTAKSPPGG